MKRLFFTFISVLSLSLHAGSTVPHTEEEIPLFPNARIDKPNCSVNENVDGMGTKESIKTYQVTGVGPEDVVNFYKARLGTDERAKLQMEFWDLKAGETSKPGIKFCFLDTLPGQCQGTSRPNGKWVKEGQFRWGHRRPDGILVQFLLSVEDMSIAEKLKGCAKKTMIMIVTSVTSEKAEKEITARMTEALKKGADLKGLDLPVYPKAKFDAKNSARDSIGNQTAYLFLTEDTPDKVARFYREKVNRPAREECGGYMITVKGSELISEESISIQPHTTSDGRAGTLIMIMKTKR